jgi:4'-phosphopantetheinyl transferase EntD
MFLDICGTKGAWIDTMNYFVSEKSKTKGLLNISSSAISNLITEAVPISIVTSCEAINNYADGLYQAEALYIRNAVSTRRMEFSTGRICARRSLSKLGISNCPIPIGTMREPVWPAGVTGSISHDGDHCIASAAKKKCITSLGIDLALAEPLNQNLIEMVCTDEEIRCIAELGDSAFSIDPYKLIFSLKESVYKCLYPIVKEIFDFQDVSISLQPTNVGAFKLLNDRLFSKLDLNINSRFLSVDRYIFSIVWLDAPN